MSRVILSKPNVHVDLFRFARGCTPATWAAIGCLALLSVPAWAQDLFVTSDATVAGGNPINATYDNVYVGVDSSFNIIGNINADVVTNAQINGQLGTYYGSALNITGGTVNNILIDDSSNLLVGGGNIGYAIVSGTGTINGGNFTDSFDTVETNGFASLTINGGKFASGFMVHDTSSLTVNGSSLATTLLSTQSNYNSLDFNNYVVSSYQLTGKLNSGTNINTTVYSAGTVAGDAGSLTFSGDASTVAPQLNLTVDSTTSGIYNDIVVGISSDGNTSTSPSVTVGSDTDTARVWAYNTSKVTIDGAIVHDAIFGEDSSTITMNSGGVDYIQGNSSSKVTVNGGSVGNVTGFGNTTIHVTDGSVDHIDAYDDTQVTVDNGLFVAISGFSNSIINFNGGNASSIYTTENAVANISGGTIADVIGQGGVINMTGGIISNSTLYNLGGTTFNLFGTFAAPTNGQIGIYDDGTTIWNGVYWDITGVFNNADVLDTRYFEANGSLRGPNYLIDGSGLHLFGITAAPEPGTVALLIIGGIPLSVVLTRRNRAGTSSLKRSKI